MGTAEMLTTATEPLAGRELTVSCTDTTGSPYSKSTCGRGVSTVRNQRSH